MLALALGLITAVFGVMFAAVQGDMKRLLAYSSIENIGLLLVGIGLTIIFHVYGKDALAALSLTATLYHSLNHAFFKSLLFIGTGSILHATGERNMGRMGGLIHHMPWAAVLMLVGVLAIAGLPPFNGFVSEWLLLQAFLLSPGLPNSYINMLVPVAAAVIALAAALAAYVMVKFYGVIFLGQPREKVLEHAHDAGTWERIGMIWLALGCVALGLAPVFVVQQIDLVSQALLGSRSGQCRRQLGVPGAGGYRTCQLQSAVFPAGGAGCDVAYHDAGAASLSRPAAPRCSLGLRIPGAECAHAGYCRRFRSADPAHLRTVLPYRKRSAECVRYASALSRTERRSTVVHPVSADQAPHRKTLVSGFAVAARSHPFVSDLYLCHAGRVAGVSVMEFLQHLPRHPVPTRAVAAGGVARTAADRLGQPVSGMVAEPFRRGRVAAVSRAAQTVPQGCGAGT